MTSLVAVHDSPRRHQRPRFHYQVPVRLWRREQVPGQIRPHLELQAFIRRLRQHALRPNRQAQRFRTGHARFAFNLATNPARMEWQLHQPRRTQQRWDNGQEASQLRLAKFLTAAPGNESEAADPPTGTTAAGRENFTPSPDYPFERTARK